MLLRAEEIPVIIVVSELSPDNTIRAPGFSPTPVEVVCEPGVGRRRRNRSPWTSEGVVIVAGIKYDVLMKGGRMMCSA